MVNLKNIQRANDLLKKAVELNNNKAVYYYDLGQTHEELEQWEEAMICYQHAVDLKKKHDDDPDDQNTLDFYYECLSEVSYKNGKLDDFLKNFENSGDLHDKLVIVALIFCLTPSPSEVRGE